MCAVWGAAPDELRWMTPPPEALLAQATELLRELDALDREGVITAHGRELAAMGVHPRLAHMLSRATELGHGGLACDLAVLLGDRDIFDVPDGTPDPDIRVRVDVMRAARSGKGARPGIIRGHRVHRGALDRALRESSHLRRSLGLPDRDGGPAEVEHVGLLLAFAYPDRIARRREGGRGRYLLRNGKGAQLQEGAALGDAEWLVAADLDARGRDARIFRAAPVAQEDVDHHFGHQTHTVEEVAWNETAGRVEARRRELLGAITVREGSLNDPARAALIAALLDGIRSEGIGSLPWTRDSRHLRDRLVFLHGLDPEHWPDRSDVALLAGLEEWLVPFLAGIDSPRRLGDLARIDLQEALLSGVAWEDRARLDEWAPTHLEVPSGARVPIDYEDPGVPSLAVRLQQVFGMTETPRIGGGRVPVTMHLLSPAHRPVQVTRDLQSFWRDAYFDVRKDLRGRYPKHPWPEDPLLAEPTNRTKRR